MTTLMSLLSRARTAGLVLADEDGKLRIRGPRNAEPLVRELLARKDDALSAVHVFNGAAPRLDWRRGRLLDQPQACILCSRPTLLLDPWDSRPCHKTCAEAAIRPAVAEAEPRSAA